MTTTTILIDDRAGSRDLVNYPPLNTSSSVTLTRLNSGDVLIPGNGPADTHVLIGVEVKSLFDLISSSNNGRLQATQLPTMLAEYDVCYLAYYGIYRPAPTTDHLQIYRGKGWINYAIGRQPVPYSYLESFLLTTAALGVRVHHFTSIQQLTLWLSILAHWWSKPWDKHRGMRALDKSREMSLMPHMDADMLQRAEVASKLPGIGFERAMNVAKYFPSILAMMQATPGEWAEIDGIGKTIANNVYTAIRKVRKT